MNARAAGLWAAYGVFPLLTLAFILGNTRPYPIWETWYFIDVWRQFAEGGPWLDALFTPRWGHIHAIPNGINLLVGSLSCYSMRVDVVIAWAVTLAALFVIARQLPRSIVIALGAASALFTARLAEVWLNSWNLMWGLSLLQAALMATCLARPTLRSVALAAAIGLSSVLTAGQGLVMVAAGAVPLLLHTLTDRKSLRYLLVWLLFTGGCAWLFSDLVGLGAPSGGLPMVDPAHVVKLLAYGLGEGDAAFACFFLVVGLCLGYVARHRPVGEWTAADFFWIYMAAFVMAFCLVLSLTRTGQLLSRYLMMLWLVPTALAYFMFRATEGRRTARAVVLWACAAWAASNFYNGKVHGDMVRSWEPLSRAATALSLSQPEAVRGEMLKGISASADEVALMDRGLATMRAMRVNIFCGR